MGLPLQQIARPPLPLLPAPFDCARRVAAKATSTAEVCFKTNRLGQLTTPPVVHPSLDLGGLTKPAPLTLPAVSAADFDALLPRGGT